MHAPVTRIDGQARPALRRAIVHIESMNEIRRWISYAQVENFASHRAGDGAQAQRDFTAPVSPAALEKIDSRDRVIVSHRWKRAKAAALIIPVAEGGERAAIDGALVDRED